MGQRAIKKMMSSNTRSKRVAKGNAIVHINPERCKGCGLCISVCSQEALSFDDRINQKGFHPVNIPNQIECIGCRYCQLMCPDVAITVVKKGKNDQFSNGNL